MNRPVGAQPPRYSGTSPLLPQRPFELVEPRIELAPARLFGRERVGQFVLVCAELLLARLLFSELTPHHGGIRLAVSSLVGARELAATVTVGARPERAAQGGCHL